MPDAAVPSADIVPRYIKTVNSVEGILSFFRALNSVFLPLLMMLHKFDTKLRDGSGVRNSTVSEVLVRQKYINSSLQIHKYTEARVTLINDYHGRRWEGKKEKKNKR
jgi:hypothetical protein